MARDQLELLAFPRDGNPYQSRLYDALGRLGVRTRYVGELSPSHSLNLLALPAELLVRRVRGTRILHVHWVFGFEFTGSYRNAWLRRASYVWYLVVLGCARAMGIHVVWTLHNVLPHQQVFPDDVRARRRLLSASSLVIAHSPQALGELRDTVGVPRHAIVMPHPRFHDAVASPRRSSVTRRVLLFGRIAAYKGIDETVSAFDDVAATTSVHLTVAGECDDPALQDRLRELARRHPDRVHLRLQHVPDDELRALFAAHDVQWLPYRQATTSGAAMMGAEMGIPLAISELPAFDAVPGLRLGQDREALAGALREIDTMSADRLAQMSEQSVRWSAAQGTWDDMARETKRELVALLAPTADPATTLKRSTC
jgi:glycosyltransferase involved in cell wall biosynthesis